MGYWRKWPPLHLLVAGAVGWKPREDRPLLTPDRAGMEAMVAQFPGRHRKPRALKGVDFKSYIEKMKGKLSNAG